MITNIITTKLVSGIEYNQKQLEVLNHASSYELISVLISVNKLWH